MDDIQPSKRVIEEALKNPNGWVYAVDKSFENIEEVPREAIKGAWKVDQNGIISGDFLPNPNYKNLDKII